MSFASPDLLWLLLLAPLLVALYFWLIRRSRATVYPNLAIIRAAQTPGGRLRRHVPPLLMLVAVVVLGGAVRRRRISILAPQRRGLGRGGEVRLIIQGRTIDL